MTALEIRNIIGSHTVNFDVTKGRHFKPKNQSKNFFRLTFTDLSEDGKKMTIVDGFSNIKKFNLQMEIKKYCRLAEQELIKIIQDYTQRLCKNDPNSSAFFEDELKKISLKKTDYSKLNKYANYEKKQNKILLNILKEYDDQMLNRVTKR